MLRSALVVLVVLLLASPLRAQTAFQGNIDGLVRDQQGALLEGAVIVATSGTAPDIGRTTTGPDGRFRLRGLSPGDYTVAVTLAGFTNTAQLATIRAGTSTTLNVVLTIAGLDETVAVTGNVPLLETLSGGQAVNISGELLRALPLAERREWFGALMLAPGVTSAEWINNQKLLYVHGADASANIVQIDGADMTSSIGATLNYVSLNTDAIDDIQVKVAGVDASAPLGLGGIISIATSSGTNRPKGAATFFVQPRRWNDSNVPGGTSGTVDQTQIDLSAGTPVVPNRLWAFAAYRFVDVSSDVSRSPAQLSTLQALIPGFTPLKSTNRADFWFTKLTAQLTPAQQLSGFYQYDVSPVTYFDPVGEHPRAEATGGRGMSARLSSTWSDHLLTRLGVSFNDKRRDARNDFADQPLQRIYQSTVRSGSRLLGSGRLVDRGSAVTGWSTQPISKATLSFDTVVFANSRLGTHEIQTGVYAQPRIRVAQKDNYTNGGFIFEEQALRRAGALDSGVVPFHRVYYDDAALTRLERQGQDFAGYVQDAWRPIARLTLSAGVRVDRISWTDRLFDVKTQQSWDIGPRLGLNYALNDAASHVIRAHWVRVHDQPTTTGTSIGTNSIGRQDHYDLDLDGSFETVLSTPATTARTADRSIDPDLHAPSIREWGAGYSRQLRGALTVSADFVHREFKDRTTLVETNGLYQGPVFVGYRDEAFNGIYQLTNNRWNWPVYSSLDLSVTKRTRRLQALASYVRQWRHIGGTWQPNDPAGFIQPQAFANNRGIGTSAGTSAFTDDANSLSGWNMTQRDTGSAQWQDHTVRLGTAATLPWGLQVATNYTFQSGAWGGPIITRLTSSDPAFGPERVTLSNGRVVDNPLATALRFAFPTRGDGQRTTPRLQVWNLRIGRTTSWRRLVIDASLDIFNVTNNGADASFEFGANQTFDPAYGLTTYRQLPRSAQAVLRVAF